MKNFSLKICIAIAALFGGASVMAVSILPQSDFLALTFGLYWLDYLIDGLESW